MGNGRLGFVVAGNAGAGVSFLESGVGSGGRRAPPGGMKEPSGAAGIPPWRGWRTPGFPSQGGRQPL